MLRRSAFNLNMCNCCTITELAKIYAKNDAAILPQKLGKRSGMMPQMIIDKTLDEKISMIVAIMKPQR